MSAFALQFWPQLLSSVLASIIVAVIFWLVALPSKQAKRLIDEAKKQAEKASAQAESTREEANLLVNHLKEERRVDAERMKSLEKSYHESVALVNQLIAEIAELNRQVEELTKQKDLKEEVILDLRRQVKQLQSDKRALQAERRRYANASEASEAECEKRLLQVASKLQGEIDQLKDQLRTVG